MKIFSIVGARPQFIKAALVSQALARTGVEEIVVHTGQHYDDAMSKVFFKELAIPEPKYNLNVGSATHGAQTGQMLEAIEKVLLDEAPDYAVVYGDTNSTVAGALAAAKLQIPLAHVEAGLRSFDRAMPEEINRIIADHLADLLFAPTITAVHNLSREVLSDGRVHFVGDVMYDAVLLFGSQAEHRSKVLSRFGLTKGDYVLATVHRASNTDDRQRLAIIISALLEMSSSVPVIFPAHPRTAKALARDGLLDTVAPRLKIVEPVGYLDMLKLEKHARLIATDSGGMQKEAFFQHVPCVTLRDTTEWPETISLGWNRLAPPTSTSAIVSALRAALESEPYTEARPYGDGHAANRIVEILLQLGGHLSTKPGFSPVLMENDLCFNR